MPRNPLPDTSALPACRACGTPAGDPCRNYKGQRKFTCAARLDPAESVQPSLFEAEETALKNRYVTRSLFDETTNPEGKL